MKKVTLTNDFHNTEVTIIIPDSGELSRRQTLKVNSTLCGNPDCCCGTIRGSQESLYAATGATTMYYEWNYRGQKVYMVGDC
jgi:hypothetical protein